MDDIAIASNSFEQHLEDVGVALAAARDGDMRVNPEKGHFFHTSVEFLAHHVSQAGITVTADKVRRIQAWLPPENLKEVRAFLGITGYY